MDASTDSTKSKGSVKERLVALTQRSPPTHKTVPPVTHAVSVNKERKPNPTVNKTVFILSLCETETKANSSSVKSIIITSQTCGWCFENYPNLQCCFDHLYYIYYIYYVVSRTLLA